MSGLVELVGFLFEGLVRRDVRRNDSIEVLDPLVLVVILELVLEIHLLADEGALGVGPEVGRLRRCREADLPVVPRVLEDLADDDPDVLVAERGHAGGILVAVGHELQQAGRDARLDDADPDAVARRHEAVALRGHLDVVTGVDLRELTRVGQVGEERESGLAGLLDEDPDRGLAALAGRNRLLAGRDEQDLEPIDVPLGDAIRRVEGERRLVVLSRCGELAELPERLGEAVFRLGVLTQLEQLAVRVRSVAPLRRGGVGNGLVRELALHPGLVDGAACGGVDFGECHGGRGPFGARSGSRRAANGGHGGAAGVVGAARLSSTEWRVASNGAGRPPGRAVAWDARVREEPGVSSPKRAPDASSGGSNAGSCAGRTTWRTN